MTSIIYKKIFEVRVLHDYFLATQDNSYFSSALSDQDRATRLLQKHNFDLDNVLQITPTSSCITTMKNYRLRFIKTKFGFFVAQEVESVIQNSGAIFYKPVLPLEASSGLSFDIRVLNSYFQNFSGIPIKKAISSIYYFSNNDDESAKTYPVLSLPVPDFDPSQVYEMGELTVKDEQLSLANITTNDDDPDYWQNIEDFGFVNRADSLLLPRKFRFLLSSNNLPTAITATLFELEGTVVKTIDVLVNGNNQLSLDFCNNPIADCVEEGWYDLEIKDQDDGILFFKRVLLNEALYNPSNFGVIEIFPGTDTTFSLVDADGFILHRINANESRESHPIFEIRFRSRNTYWRYKSKDAFSPTDTGTTDSVLDIAPDTGDTVLIAKKSETLVEGVNKLLEGLSLPNPNPSTMKYGTDGKIYSDIYISSINRFLS